MARKRSLTSSPTFRAQKLFIASGGRRPMDEFKPSTQIVEFPRGDLPHTVHYQLIGHTLSVCESGSIRVGIPWLPPTRRVWNLRSHLEGTLEYFLRYNLVEVPTLALESYCEDLLQHRELPLAESYFLDAPSSFERWAFAVGSVTLLSVTTFLTFTALQSEFSFSALVTVIVGGAAALFAATLSSDEHRRLSFAWALWREISRRKGLDPNNSGNLRACPT